MSTLTFSADIRGAYIDCAITVPQDMPAPVFCFSLMAPPAVERGGTLIRSEGGYGEVQLPDLEAGTPYSFVLRHADAEFTPTNRAWLPLGAYLRTGQGIVDLPKLPAGVLDAPEPVKPEKDGLCLIPEPKSWHPAQGSLRLDHVQTRPGLWRGLEALAKRCKFPPLQGASGVPLTIDRDAALPDEGYRLVLKPDGIAITHGDDAGLHYAGITLLVLRRIHDGLLPCGVLEDAPRFSWRGQHLDCARHFYETGTITRLMDVMALLKMNRFHWHFSDDEAFRLQLDSVPEVTEKTALRGETHLVPGVFGGGALAGGSYSKTDARRVIQHGRDLFIEVLPEIEFPAHALAFAKAFPETRDPNDTGTERSVQGYAHNVLNPAMPQTWSLINAIADEVGALFPFGVLHLGADELPGGTWNGSPAIADLKRQEGLTSCDDVLGWALERLASRLAGNGVRPAAWEEAARGQNGGIGNNAILFSWTGQQPGINAAKAGYDIVMCPAQHVYLDMAHSGDSTDWGADWAAFVSLQQTIAWAVAPDPAIADRVIGVQGTFWSEFTTADHEMEPMIAPRIFGVATRGWSDEDERKDARFLSNARWFCTVLDDMGWRWNQACFS